MRLMTQREVTPKIIEFQEMWARGGEGARHPTDIRTYRYIHAHKRTRTHTSTRTNAKLPRVIWIRPTI